MEDCIEHNQGGSEQVYACTCRTTRLSPEDVEFIRSSGLTGKELAAQFNVSQGTISLARRKLTHK